MSDKPTIASYPLTDDGVFPNSRLPLVMFAAAVALSGRDPARIVEDLFRANGWGDAWRDGIYTYHHYHSTAHEALGVYRGTATVQLGGPHGVALEVHPGDVIVIPAGVAHKNLRQSDDFAVVGAYPDRQRMDMNYGRPGERPAADERISRVPLPTHDPVHGSGGPLLALWATA